MNGCSCVNLRHISAIAFYKTWGNSSVISVYIEIGEHLFLHVYGNFFALGRLSVRTALYSPLPPPPPPQDSLKNRLNNLRLLHMIS